MQFSVETSALKSTKIEIKNTIIEKTGFKLYPNPSFEEVNFIYILEKEANVHLTIYSVNGQKIKSLIENEIQVPGNYSRIINVSTFENGVYFAKFTMDGNTKTYKMIVKK